MTEDACPSKDIFKEQQDAVLEHLAKHSGNIVLSKCTPTAPVLPTVGTAMQKLNEYMKKVKPVSKAQVELPAPLAKWSMEPEGAPKTQTLGDHEFPTLSQLGQHSPSKKTPEARSTFGDETECSRNQSSENREKELEGIMSALSELDQLILRRVQSSIERQSSPE